MEIEMASLTSEAIPAVDAVTSTSTESPSTITIPTQPKAMADYERRHGGGGGGGGGGGYQNRKRRYRDDDEFYDRRPARRPFKEPLPNRIRRSLLSLATSSLTRPEDDILLLAKLLSDNNEDLDGPNTFIGLVLQMILEQPLKIPFLAATCLVLNGLNRGEEVFTEVLEKVCKELEERVALGEWRGVKCCLKFLGGVQGALAEEGVWSVLTELFERAVDLQTASSDDTIGTELVKIILYTIPYIMASSATDSVDAAAGLLEKTDIVVGQPHPLEGLVNPYPGNGKDQITEPVSIISLLQNQLQAEANNGWELACLPRPWKMSTEGDQEDPLALASKHTLPTINIPETVIQGSKQLFPEIYFSVYGTQDVETVPLTSDIASTLLRDSLVDTINVLDFNRMATSRFLIDVDCYFAPGTFVKRATPFDKLKEVQGDQSTWKPEDVAVDAVFSQLFQLPTPEHKLVYYHSVLTEACKIAPAAIAPSLGRAIRFLYKNVDLMDYELSFRMMDWFSHHLSNFGFTWKWTEWQGDVELPDLHPKKAFIEAALDKEIRLSFAQRIKGTLPGPYQPLISESKIQDVPDFKYDNPDAQFSIEGKEILALLKRKAPEEEIEIVIEKIHDLAITIGHSDPILASTDAYVTAICTIGSKSLSHALSCIERCRTRLLSIAATSSAAQRQIILSVFAYWNAQPGIAVNIVDKLLNYTILSPGAVLDYALGHDGALLAKSYIYELADATVRKVTKRVRQIATSRDVKGLSVEQRETAQTTLVNERAAMKTLFAFMEDALRGWAMGTKVGDDAAQVLDEEEREMVKMWGERWLRVFRRRVQVEESWAVEADARSAAAFAAAAARAEREEGAENGSGGGEGMDVEVV